MFNILIYVIRFWNQHSLQAFTVCIDFDYSRKPKTLVYRVAIRPYFVRTVCVFLSLSVSVLYKGKKGLMSVLFTLLLISKKVSKKFTGGYNQRPYVPNC